MADKMTKMELEEPDKLQIFFEESLEYVKHNRTKIMMIAAAVVALLLLIAGWFIYDRTTENKAGELYQAAFLLEKSEEAEGAAMAVIGSFSSCSSRVMRLVWMLCACTWVQDT